MLAARVYPKSVVLEHALLENVVSQVLNLQVFQRESVVQRLLFLDKTKLVESIFTLIANDRHGRNHLRFVHGNRRGDLRFVIRHHRRRHFWGVKWVGSLWNIRL